MTDIRGFANLNPSITEQELVGLHANRVGDLYVADAMNGQAIAGNLFAVNVGSGSTPVTFNAAYAAAEQDFYLYVPSTVVVIPIYISVQMEDTGTAAVLDTLAAVSSTADSAVTGTAQTIRKVNTGGSGGSACTATAVVTAAGTDPTSSGYFEFWRPYAGAQEDAFNGSTTWVNPFVGGAYWSAKEAGYFPVISGGGSLSVYAGAQAGIGFMTIVWLERTANFVS